MTAQRKSARTGKHEHEFVLIQMQLTVNMGAPHVNHTFPDIQWCGTCGLLAVGPKHRYEVRRPHP